MSILVISETPLRVSNCSAREQYGQTGVLYMVIFGMVLLSFNISKNRGYRSRLGGGSLGFGRVGVGGMMGGISLGRTIL